ARFPRAIAGRGRQGLPLPGRAATAAELAGKGGLYLEDCREGEPVRPDVPFAGYHAHVRDPEAARRLWAVSEEMLGESVAFWFRPRSHPPERSETRTKRRPPTVAGV